MRRQDALHTAFQSAYTRQRQIPGTSRTAHQNDFPSRNEEKTPICVLEEAVHEESGKNSGGVRTRYSGAIARGNKKGVQPVAYPVLWVALATLAALSASCAGKPTQPAEDIEQTAKAAAPERDPAEIKRNNEATAEYHYSMAQAYVAEGNPDGAIEELKLTLMYDPNSALDLRETRHRVREKGHDERGDGRVQRSHRHGPEVQRCASDAGGTLFRFS